MDPDTRRALGAHYTSEENILKVIRPLFLDGLYDEFEKCKATTKELKAFQDRLASIVCLDIFLQDLIQFNGCQGALPLAG